jgi:acetylornithine/N-succinyldiaminopimelate aminotransferase
MKDARMTTTSTDAKALESQYLLQNYRRFPVVFERGEGMRLYDQSGRAYLDFLSGIGVNSLGHAHPALVKALSDQVAVLAHTSNLYYHPLQGELAARLVALTGLQRAFFCNSGTEAMEGCLKFARRYWYGQGRPRTNFVAFSHSFHGRTMGAVAVTWDEHYRTPFGPLVPGARWCETDDPAELAALVDDETAAIVVEPIRGEGGVRPIPIALAQAITAACERTGALLITDEVQSGSGRTGTFLHGPSLGLKADLVALAKALGAGMPVGAVVMSSRIADSIVAGDHGTTYGGNLLACRAALTFLDALDAGVASSMRRVSTYLFDRLHALQASTNGSIKEVRGTGFIAGLDLAADALPVVNGALERGLIVNRTSNTVVRMLPAYIATERDVDEAIGILDASIRATL